MSVSRHARAAALQSASLIATLALCAAARAADPAPADLVMRNGIIATVDANDHVLQAIAIRAGRIAYVGSDAGVESFIGVGTQVTDLQGHMVMPGLVDGHLHPLDGGAIRMTCNLDYAPLTLAQFGKRIQACLDASKEQEPAGWLRVTGWYRQFMRPAGTDVNAAVLDRLKTERPIAVESTDGHTIVTNHRGLALAAINGATPDVADGRIVRDKVGNPTGLLEDGGQHALTAVFPRPNAAEERKRARAALAAIREQGITTFLDAAASPGSIAAFAAIYKAGGLTARAHFAPVIDAKDAADPAAVVTALKITRALYDSGPIARTPAITVRNAKIFLDGVLQAPAQTAVLMAPYNENFGHAGAPHWVVGTKTGDVTFPPETLNPLMVALGEAGIEPHIHASGDRAVHQALDAIEVMRNAVPDPELRAAIVHAELIDPSDYTRFEALNAIPVMSFQWAKPGPDSIDATRDYLGPERFARLEPEGLLFDAHARIAYGSDWPVDRLDEWFALKVGITRSGDPALGARYTGRLNAQRGLPREFALRAITMNSSYELHQDADSGSLEVGKLADLIVLDRNILKVPAEKIAGTRVLMTMVGGTPVYRAKGF
jgi:predicted amidohydrolase YtcJ